MKTLYVHIGTPKTGTTAIQRFMYENRKLLLEKGVSYEAPPYRFERIGVSRNAHFLFGIIRGKDGCKDTAKMTKVREEGLDFILGRFEVCDKVVISDEILWVQIANGSDVITKLARWAAEHGITLKVIVYLRRQDKYADSLWKQAVKQSVTYMTFKEYIGRKRFAAQVNYYEILEGIAADVGRGNIIVRRFDRNYFPGGKIQADFLGITGLSLTDEYDLGRELQNTSTDNNYTEILRQLNSLSETPALRFNRVNRFFADIALRLSAKDKDETAQISAGETREYMEKFREGNRKIAAEYLGEDGDLFDAGIPDASVWSDMSREYRESVIKYFGQGLIDLSERVCELSVNELK